jgi:putative (di)nucleoside polyphosphate hydrolase
MRPPGTEAVSCVQTEQPPGGYRRCVGILLLNEAGLAFAGRRHDTEGEAWQMPQGGIDPGELPEVAARREMLEEIGTDRAELLRESSLWRSYDLPADLARRMWRGRYRGQSQKWLAFRFTGSDADIRLDGPHPEFSAWRWLPPDDLPGLIVPFKRDVYVSVVAEFRHLWA